MMSERLRSRDPKSNTTKSYTMFFEDDNKFNSLNNSSNSGNNNTNVNSDNSNINNSLKKFLKKQMNLSNNNNNNGSSNSGGGNTIGIGDNLNGGVTVLNNGNDDKLNRELFENFNAETLANLVENGRKRKYDKIKEEESAEGNDLDEDNQKQIQQQHNNINNNNSSNNNNENQHTNDELNENLNERNFNEQNLNENDAKKTKLDNSSKNNSYIESQAMINRNLQRLLHQEEDEENVDDDLEPVSTGDDPPHPIINFNSIEENQPKDNNNDIINIPSTNNISNNNSNINNNTNYSSVALNNSAYLESLEIIKKIKYDDTREIMYQVYQPWVLQTYGDSAKTKTITMKKQERIIKTLTGQETNNADSSKFRFWVKSKGFTTEKPKEFKEIEIDRTNLSNEQRLEDKNVCLLYVPNFSKDSTAQPYRKVAVVEYFFDIIFEVHVGLGGRSGRHAGQKRTYRTISESYAFLPREAVTKFLSGCILCRKFPIRTFTTFTSKFLEEQLTDSSTEFNENSPKSELCANTDNLNINNNNNNNSNNNTNNLSMEEKKLNENTHTNNNNDSKILNNDNNGGGNSSNNNNTSNNNTNTATGKENDDGIKLSVDWEEEINLETSKSNEKKFVTNINNINNKIENDLLHELNENFFMSAAAATSSSSDDKNCIKNITITNELVTYYHLLKQFYEQQNTMKINASMAATQSPTPSTSSGCSVSTSSMATTNITKTDNNDVVNLVQQQNQLRQIRLPQKNLMEDYKNLPLIMSTLSQSFKQSDLLLQVQQQQQQQISQALVLPSVNSQSLIDLTITKSPSPQPVEIKSPQLSPKTDQPINNININMNSFDNLSINVSTNIDKNKVKILCNTTPPKKRYNNFFTTTNATPLTSTISNTISSASSPSSSSSTVSSTLSTISSASILNDNINFMNKLLLSNNNDNATTTTCHNSNNNLIFKQKNEKIENIIKKCEMKNQQHINNNNNNNNNSGSNNNNSSNNVFQINPITSTYLNMTRSMGLTDDDALKFDELGVKMFCDENVTTVSDVSDNHVDDPYAGVMKDADKLKLMLLAWNYQNSAAVRNGTEGPDLAAVSGLWAQYQNALAMQAAVATKPPTSPVKLDSPIEQQDETNSSGQKDDDDMSDDDLDDRLDQTPHDPERLKAFNMFVRLFVDENLDRMVPISKQPKEKIQAIIDSCTRQFPEFAERSRKRIRTYLKSCRRNKKTRDGWETTSRPTPAHLTSVQAEQILASACDNESMNAKRMRMGMEPISQAVSPSLINTIETSATSSYMSSILKSSNNSDTLTMPSISTLGKPSPSSSSSSSSILSNNLGDTKNLSATITSSSSINNNNLIGGPMNNGQSMLTNNNNNNPNNNNNNNINNSNNNSSNSSISNNNNKMSNNNKLIPPPNALYRNEFSKPNNTNYPSGSGGGSGGSGGGGGGAGNSNNNTNNNIGQGNVNVGVNMNNSNTNGRSNSSMPPPSSTPTQPTYPTFISHNSNASNNASGNNLNNNNNNNNNNTNNINKSSTNGPTDLSMKQLKPPLLAHKLNASELDAVRQLVTGYRESAAFLLRSADELEQLLLSQQQ